MKYTETHQNKYPDNISISVVIPLYNSSIYIEQTLDSIINQSYPVKEIVVVDDYSEDNSAEIIKRIQRKSNIPILFIEHDRNFGVSKTRNDGVKIAKGEWILFIDSDDVANVNLTYEQVKKIKSVKQSTDWVVIHSACEEITKDGIPIKGFHRFKQVDKREILGYEFVRNHVYLSGALVRRNVLIEVGGFDEELTHAEDWDLWLRLAHRGGFLYINKSLFQVRRHPQNASKNVSDMINSERKILKKYSLNDIEIAISKRNLPVLKNKIDYISILFRLDMYEEVYEKLIDLVDLYPYQYEIYFYLGLFYLKNNKTNEAIKMFEKVLFLNGTNGAALNNLGGLELLKGDFQRGRNLLKSAIRYYPGYVDATYNLKLIESKRGQSIEINDLKITWRPLRKHLTNYILE